MAMQPEQHACVLARPYQQAELQRTDRLVESQHEVAISLLALVALGHLQQAPYHIPIQCHGMVHCCFALGLQQDTMSLHGPPLFRSETAYRIQCRGMVHCCFALGVHTGYNQAYRATRCHAHPVNLSASRVCIYTAMACYTAVQPWQVQAEQSKT